MLKRKILTASLVSSVYAIILGFFVPSPIFEAIITDKSFFYGLLSFIAGFLLYSFPVIIIYGSLTSYVSDKAGQFLGKKTDSRLLDTLVSLSLHLCFGLILGLYSLGASLLFFITDRLLQKREKPISWLLGGLSLLIPVALFFICLGIIRLLDS